MAQQNPPAGAGKTARDPKKKVDIGELEARVMRLELEARELEAKNKIFQGRALLEKNKAQGGARNKTAGQG